MGLTHDDPRSGQPSAQQQSAPQPQSQAQSQQSPPQRPSLPPEAIALAHKLFDCARSGDTSTLSSYLSAGIPPNLTDHNGNTLLMLACYHGHADTARTLISRGADVDTLNDRGQSVIAGAVFKGHDEVVRLLHERRADLRRGQPSAVDAAKMFRREDYLVLFGVEDDGVMPWENPSAAARGSGQ